MAVFEEVPELSVDLRLDLMPMSSHCVLGSFEPSNVGVAIPVPVMAVDVAWKCTGVACARNSVGVPDRSPDNSIAIEPGVPTIVDIVGEESGWLNPPFDVVGSTLGFT